LDIVGSAEDAVSVAVGVVAVAVIATGAGCVARPTDVAGCAGLASLVDHLDTTAIALNALFGVGRIDEVAIRVIAASASLVVGAANVAG
jgi:hypothetical protein